VDGTEPKRTELRREMSGGIIDAGGFSGAKKTAGWEQRHADLFYEEVRHRTTDVKQIADNTPFTEKAVDEIKQHIFFKEHDLGSGRLGRFASDYEQAQAWDRLTQGTHTDLDVMFLKHEYVELTQMRLHGYDYEAAHDKANENHDWWTAILKERVDRK
jgi:hypothetical protein